MRFVGVVYFCFTFDRGGSSGGIRESGPCRSPYYTEGATPGYTYVTVFLQTGLFLDPHFPRKYEFPILTSYKKTN